VRGAEKEEETAEREEELKVLLGKEIAEEVSQARCGGAIFGLGGRFHYGEVNLEDYSKEANLWGGCPAKKNKWGVPQGLKPPVLLVLVIVGAEAPTP
jgi:hypothetical protein